MLFVGDKITTFSDNQPPINPKKCELCIEKKRIMNRLLIVNLCLILICAGQTVRSADSIRVTMPDMREWLKFDGAIKTKLEISTDSGSIRFNVRNSRMGLRGDIGEYLSYRVQVELSSEGSFAPLDLFGTLKPAKGLSISLGQTSVPFENSYIITPAEMMFSNRAFVGKFFTPGSRDIGAVIHYRFVSGKLPFELQAGTFNGGRINNPQWTDRPSYALRMSVGKMEGFRTSAKIYRYAGETLDLLLWGADLHYAGKRLRLEAEAMNRNPEGGGGETLFGAYIQGAYVFDLNRSKIFHNLWPALRWDAMGYGTDRNGFDVNRLTFGLNFGLSLKPFASVLRVDYEQYFVRGGHFPEFDNRDLHVSDNKLTIELLIKF